MRPSTATTGEDVPGEHSAKPEEPVLLHLQQPGDTVGSQTTAVKNERLIRLNQAIQDGKSNLAGLKQSFTEDYPDIKTLEARLAALEKERDDMEQQEIERAATFPGHLRAAEGRESANAEEPARRPG